MPKFFRYFIIASFLVLFSLGHVSFAASLGTNTALAKSTDARLQTFAEKMVTIYSVIVGKLEDQADRVGKTLTRLDEGTDADLSDAKDQLKVARIKIKAARKSVTELDSTVTSILKRGEKPKIELKEIREEISDVREKISDAHNSLQYAIILIKEEFDSDEEDAVTSTSTPTTTPAFAN